MRQRTAAGVVPFVKENGYLRCYTLPTVKGLFAHERISLGAVLHEYLANWRFVTRVEGLPGTVFVPTVAEGHINFGWLGAATFSLSAFLAVTFMQEILLRLRMGLLSFPLMAWYAYLSMSIAMTSVFATIVSFVHTYVLIFCISSY